MSPDPTTVYPAFYDMNGVPVRKLRPTALPEKMLPNGQWESFADPGRFATEAQRVDPNTFAALCAEWASGPGAPQGMDGGPLPVAQ